MFDLWAFLLQTLTASGVAALLLLLKALFQDKLPPKWQFAVWSVLALMLLLPAGYHGRYVLVHWQVPIEMLKAWCGDFGFTQVYFPLPFVKAIPTTVSGWLFVLYTAGVIFFAAKYMLSYISLRHLASGAGHSGKGGGEQHHPRQGICGRARRKHRCDGRKGAAA